MTAMFGCLMQTMHSNKKNTTYAFLHHFFCCYSSIPYLQADRKVYSDFSIDESSVVRKTVYGQ